MLRVTVICVWQLQWDGSWGGRHRAHLFLNPAEQEEASGIAVELLNNLRV